MTKSSFRGVLFLREFAGVMFEFKGVLRELRIILLEFDASLREFHIVMLISGLLTLPW